MVYRFILIIIFSFTAFSAFAQEKRQGWFRTFIHSAIFVDSTRREPKKGQVVDEERALRKYNGKTIGKIVVSRHDVYEKRRSLFQRAANWAHIVTMEKIVRNDLLMAEGDVFDAARMDVEEELFGDAGDDDPDWKPINLDELPEDEEE